MIRLEQESLLDELKEVLWETYGAEIIEQQQQSNQLDEQQRPLDF